MIKIITDSSSNLIDLPKHNYSSVPLKILIDDNEYIDDKRINIDNLIAALKKSHRTSTSCPGVKEWLDAFVGNDERFVITITSALSGSYTSAHVAAETYLKSHPNAKIHVIDSLSTGPKIRLMVEMISDCIDNGDDFETIKSKITEYQKKTYLIFSQQSIDRLASSGRFVTAISRVVNAIGIRIIGESTSSGTVNVIGKCRTEKNALSSLFKEMKRKGFKGGKVCITHCKNILAAQTLKNFILKEFP